MLRFIIVLAFLGMFVSFAQNTSNTYNPIQGDIDEGDRKVTKWSNFLEKLPENENLSGSDLEKLALMVSSSGPNHYSADRWRSDEVYGLYLKARERLLAQEGHATYFAEKIIAIHERLEADEINWPLARGRAQLAVNKLDDMPSHECVVALMDLLEMQSNWFGNRFFGREQTLFKGQKPNDQSASIAGMAASALYEIGIEDGAPKVSTLNNGQIVQLEHGLGGDFFVHEWEKWWQEVVDGKRTFGFKGDPRRYNHLGVVEIREASGKKGETNLSASKPQVKGLESSQTKNPRSLSWLYWMLGTLISGGIGVLVWNHRNSSSAR